VKETSILMSGDHPSKCLDGTKTMTRRTWGLKEINKDPDKWVKATQVSFTNLWRFEDRNGDLLIVKCPYGGVGDRLWVRETFAVNFKGQVLTRADKDKLTEMLDLPDIPIKWKPSIHMPRWASRITLEITEIRVERVQEITEEDAEAEGVSWSSTGPWDNPETISAVENFAWLWDSLNAKRGYPWDGNWWVWRMPYKKLEGKAP